MTNNKKVTSIQTNVAYHNTFKFRFLLYKLGGGVIAGCHLFLVKTQSHNLWVKSLNIY